MQHPTHSALRQHYRPDNTLRLPLWLRRVWVWF